MSDSDPAAATILAEVLLPTRELRDDLPFWTGVLGFRLENIFPADDPAAASLSGYGLRVRIEKGAPVPPGKVRILTDDPDRIPGGPHLVAPNGTEVEVAPLTPRVAVPPTRHAFGVRRLRDGAPWVVGRAGMRYRDLVPSRLGGAMIASHIRVPGGGPVPDMVHHHTVGFQLIYCHRGWVDVLYEDQGDRPLRMEAGDCVIQPPGIRHQVCEASPEIEVVELGVPAQHMTTIDHETTLPNGWGDPAREWEGQRFVHHVRATAAWRPFRLPGFTCQETGISAGTGGVAGVQVARARGAAPVRWRHDGDIHFTFVTEGTMVLWAEGEGERALEAGDAFVVPPGMAVAYREMSADLEILEASLPARFRTDLL